MEDFIMSFVDIIILSVLIFVYLYAILDRICKCKEHCCDSKNIAKLHNNDCKTSAKNFPVGKQ